MSHTDKDRLDLIDELNNEFASLKAIHLLMHTHLKAALSSNDLNMTRDELRAFSCGIENLVNPRYSKASELLKILAQSTI